MKPKLLLPSCCSDTSPTELAEIEQTLAQMPTPHPGYQLSLQYQDQHFSVDLWEFAIKSVFATTALDESGGSVVEIDTSN